MRLLHCKEFTDLCATDFQKKILVSAYSRIHDLNDPFRINLFALLVRELIGDIMEREAPDESVKRAEWFRGYQDSAV